MSEIDALVLYTPKLTGGGIQPPNAEQVWTSYQKDILNNVSDGIDVDDAAKLRGVSSIPDVWARPLLFHMALTNPHHPLHAVIVQEWRGLMALIVLKDFAKNYRLEVTPVPLTGSSNLEVALANLDPHRRDGGVPLGAKGDRYSWTDVHVILFEGQPIGATSPTTLIFTAADYRSLTNTFKERGIEIAEKTRTLIEPSDPLRRGILKYWLDDYLLQNLGRGQTRLKSDLNIRDDHAKSLYAAFISWQEELAQVAPAAIPAGGKITLHTDETPFPQAKPVFQNVFRPVTIEGLPKQSDMLLKANKSFVVNGKTYDRIVVICEETLNLEGGNPRVYDALRANTIKDRYKSFPASSFVAGNQLNNIPLDPNVAWIRPELFFLSDTLYMRDVEFNFLHDGLKEQKNSTGKVARSYRDEADDIASYNIDGRFILPIAPELLRCFTPEEIRTSLRPTYTVLGNGSDVKFAIRLPVVSDNGDQFTVNVERTYRAKPDASDTEAGKIISNPDIFYLEIWPNFQSPNWNRYFLFTDSLKFQYTPYSDVSEHTPTIFTARIGNKDETVYIARSDFFPAVLLCQYNGEHVGVIFIKCNPVNPPSKTWNVGIDFGTSNTSIWVREIGQTDRIEQLAFTVHTKKITNIQDSGRHIDLPGLFTPPGPPPVPFVSALRVFDDGAITKPESQLFVNYAIHFINNAGAFYRSSRSFQTYANIKWADASKPEELSRIRGFLDHVATLIAAEAVKNAVAHLKLFVSYPIAMDKRAITHMVRSWEQVTKEFNDTFAEAITINDGKRVKDMACYTESVCAGRYFGSRDQGNGVGEGINTFTGALVIDIGGGTSDICVWAEEQIKYQTSILLAGNILSDCFRNCRGLHKSIFDNIDPEVVDQLSGLQTSEKEFWAALNLNLLRHQSKINGVLPNLIHDPYFHAFSQILLVTFGAITFYSGMVVTSLKNRNRLSPKTLEFELGWAGNASGFTKWADFGDDRGEIIHTVFERMLAHFGLKLLRNKITRRPKAEVACGLILDPVSDESLIDFGDIIGGESIRLTGALLQDGEYKMFLQQYPDAEPILNGVTTRNGEVVTIDYSSLPPPVKASFGNSVLDFLAQHRNVSFDAVMINEHILDLDIAEFSLGEQFTTFVKLLNSTFTELGYDPIRMADFPTLRNEIVRSIGGISRKAEQTLKTGIGEPDAFADVAVQKLAQGIEPVFVIEVKELIKQMAQKMAAL